MQRNRTGWVSVHAVLIPRSCSKQAFLLSFFPFHYSVERKITVIRGTREFVYLKQNLSQLSQHTTLISGPHTPITHISLTMTRPHPQPQPSDLRSSSRGKTKNLGRFLPPLNFITLHYAYFIVTCLVVSLVFWLSPIGEAREGNGKGRIEFVDALFLVVSAMTEAGLNTVNLSEMTTFQQIILFLLIIIGSTIFVSVGTVWTRKRVFEKRFKGIVKSVREGKRRGNGGLLGGNDGVREVGVGERLEEQRKEREGGDERVFESRHSGPRDPTQLPLSTRSRDLVETRSLAGDSKMNGNLNPGSGTGTGGRGVGEEGKEDVEMQGLENSHSRTRTGARSRSQGTGTGAEDRDHISTKRHSASSQDPGFSTGITPEPPHRLLSFVGVDAHRHTLNAGSASAYSHPQHAHSTLIHRTEKPSEGIENTTGADHSGVELDQAMYPHYLTRRTTGRNAQFHGLTREEREHLGGVEYRAITLLGWVVPVYFVAWQVLGCVGLGAYNKINKEEVIRANGINPWYDSSHAFLLCPHLRI
ncbi:hypothetical protein WAI453_004494 [Rhynchosporium graminicola]